MKHLILTALLGTVAAGMASAGDVWTYTDCVEYAREHNISLRKTMLDEQTAANDLEAARAQWEPTLDFATTHGFIHNPFASGRTAGYSGSYGLNAGWTAWDGRKRDNNIKRGELDVEIARMNTRSALRTLEADLLQVYINILYARDAVAIAEEAVKLSEAQADRARQLMEGGRASKVDYAQLKSQYEQDCYSLVEARGVYDTRRMELKKLLQLGIDSDIEPAMVEWTAEQVTAPLPPIEQSYDMALATDLQLQGLDKEKEGADIDVAIARAGNSPSVTLNASVGTTNNVPGTPFFTGLKRNFGENIGVTLSIPILDNKKTRTAVANANVRRLNADLDIEQRRNDLAQAVESWYVDTRSAQSRFEAAREKVSAAEVSNELTTEQFRLGLVNPVELVNAHVNLVEARYSMLQAKYMAMLGRRMIEYYRTAVASVD